MPTRPAATTWEATPTKKARIDKKAEEGAVDTPSPQTVFDLLGQVRPLNQDDYGWNKFWIPPDSVEEYVSTLRQQCGHSSAAFRWPHSKLSFQKAFELTLHLMPLGHMSAMQNGTPIPKDSDTWEVCHHGTSPQVLLKIVREGLRPATSAVSEQVGQKYGIKLDDGQTAKVPTIGLTNKWSRALEFPKARDGQLHYSSTPPATIIAEDGTYPMRCVLRVLVPPRRRHPRAAGRAVHQPCVFLCLSGIACRHKAVADSDGHA